MIFLPKKEKEKEKEIDDDHCHFVHHHHDHVADKVCDASSRFMIY
jgi:hypothetical protein